VKRRAVVVLALLLPLLAACAGREPAPLAAERVPAPPIVLSVGYVDVEDRSAPLPQANFIDERRSHELNQSVQSYLRERLQAGGGAGSAVAVIERASITERLREGRRGGVLGFMQNEPTWDMDGNVAVRVVLRDASGSERGFTATSVGRARAVSAGASIVERDNAAQRLIADLLVQLGPALEQAVAQNLSTRG
jgi:hypothetical protein